MSVSWYLEDGPSEDVVISTRVRLARNIDNTPFPWRLTPEEKDQVRERVEVAFREVCDAQVEKPLVVDLAKMDDIAVTALADKRVISRNMLRKREGEALFLFGDESAGILVNEEDHLRLFAIGAGLCFEKTAYDVSKNAAALEERIPMAKSERLGYLTSCPTNTGTGMRASCMLHIPGLIRTGIVGDLSRKLARAGFALRGADGEGSEPYADMVQLSNQVTLGVTEERTLQDMTQLAENVASEERKARQQLYDRDRVGLEDKIGRVKGKMLFARRMSTEEAMKGLSLLRLGRELELPDMPKYRTIQALFASVGAGAIQQQMGRPLDGWERDEARADIIRECLSQEKI
ncbi:MAG: hypothetical protein GX939_09080 [Clostridiaceae bacterium]|jgi:protein arginine kinase|nr:hypothetical protein [Clostridiaceae bacterium]